MKTLLVTVIRRTKWTNVHGKISLKSRVWDKVPEESTIIFGGNQISFKQSVGEIYES